MGAAMTGMRPIAEIMFADFYAVCWDIVVNEIAKARYMTNGQVNCPLVIKSGNGGSVRFGAQHSQSVENWAMAVPGIKVVAPSTPTDIIGLMAAAVHDPDPVLLFEHKGLYATKDEVPNGEIVDTLGTAKVLRHGTDCTIVALGLMVARALAAADQLAADGINATVIDLRSLIPLDMTTVLASVSTTTRLFTVEEKPPSLRLGRRSRLHHRQRSILEPRRPHHTNHHPTPPPTRSRRTRRPRHPIHPTHHHHNPRIAELTGER